MKIYPVFFALACVVGGCVGDAINAPEADGGSMDASGDANAGDAMADGSMLTDGNSDVDAADARRPVPTAKGDFGWVLNISTLTSGGGLAFDNAGNAFFAFNLRATVTVDGTHQLTSAGGSDIALVKVDPTGHVTGAWKYGVVADEEVDAITCDGTDVYLTGSFQGATLPFGNGKTLTRVASTDPYVVKISGSDGTALWADDFAKAASTYAVCGNLAAGGGRIAVACSSEGALGITLTGGRGPGTISPVGVGSSVSSNMYLIELDPATGDAFWGTAIGADNQSQENFSALAVDSVGALLFTFGSFGDVIHNASNSLNITYAGVAGACMFVAKLAATNGEGLWIKEYTDGTTNNSNQTFPGGVATDSMNNVIVGGKVLGTVPLGGGKSVSSQTSGGTNYDPFIAKLDSAGTPIWARTFGGSDQDDEAYVALDQWDEIFAAGSYRSANATVDTFPLPAVPGPVNTHVGGYFLKLESTMGKALWAKGTIGSGTTNVNFNGVAVDPASGGAAITGTYANGAADLGDGNPVIAGGGNVFAVKRSP